MQISVIEKEELKAVGLAWNGTYEHYSQILNPFSMLKDRFHEIHFKKNQTSVIGLYHHRETEMTYYAGVLVEEFKDIPQGMIGISIPKKSYVFCRMPSSTKDVQKTCKQMNAWMEEYGYEKDERALCLNVYMNGTEKNSSKLDIIEIYFPIKKY